MRYNPDTERGIVLEDVASYFTLPAPKPGSRVWDCQNGHWIDIPAEPQAEAETEPAQVLSEHLAVVEATLNLWAARHKLQQLEAGSVPAATIASLKRDVQDIARELQRLS